MAINQQSVAALAAGIGAFFCFFHAGTGTGGGSFARSNGGGSGGDGLIALVNVRQTQQFRLSL